jgi:hypothetical protein
MKVEIMNLPGKGTCIVISEIDANSFRDRTFFVEDSSITNAAKIASELSCGRKIAAIKELRAQTGWGLRRAEYYIDEYIPVYQTVGTHRDMNMKNREAAIRFLKDHTSEDFIKDEDFGM